MAAQYEERTAWTRSLETPLRHFLRTETSSAAFLLGATAIALVWVNVHASSYDSFWTTQLSVRLGSHALSLDLRGWVNSGLMTFFFFVVGLEARREFDLGELRERRRSVLPLTAALAGMVTAVALYLAVNAGHSTAHGWGAAMSTDTAFALGVLSVVGPRGADRLRAFLLTVVVADDLVALVVIATVYTETLRVGALLVAAGLFLTVLVARALHVRRGAVYFAIGAATWVALERSGVDPVVVGLAMGLLTYAYSASRVDLERATERFREFREQPTAELARTARAELNWAISPNDRLQQVWHPIVSYAIVPVFALANAGIAIDGAFLSRAFTSPVTLGIVLGYVVGKPLGVFGSSLVLSSATRSRLRPPVGWAAVGGAGALTGIGFTVSLLVATLAFRGATLEEAKAGILTAALASSLGAWGIFAVTRALPRRMRIRALLGSAAPITDLYVDVDPERDHLRGPDEAPVTLVEYGDFECPYCGQAEPIVRELLQEFGDVRYVWRHLPLTDVHPHAQLAAEASEAAAAQGAFWPMHDLLLDRQDALRLADLVRYAEELGLDAERFEAEVRSHEHRTRVAEDVDGADLSGVSGTPTFFINGSRHYGAYDIDALSRAVRLAGARSTLAT
ncbi:MAG TPA: Na+/H+ antiporter NhaA [Gaiellaceae bacterium]|nr:Na+/H+ antiporter NhaA [Gaiellaceae bacterium]